MLWNIVRKECILTKKKRTLTTFQFYKAESCDLQDHQHHLQEIMEQPGLLHHRYCYWVLGNTHPLERNKYPKSSDGKKCPIRKNWSPIGTTNCSSRKIWRHWSGCPLFVICTFLMSVNFSLVWRILNQSFFWSYTYVMYLCDVLMWCPSDCSIPNTGFIVREISESNIWTRAGSF